MNDISGDCIEEPSPEQPGTFARIFGGHGLIFHQEDNPPNPFFVKSWAEVFSNPELLPLATKNVFVDSGFDAECDFIYPSCFSVA